MTFIDTNVLVDWISDDPHWADWSISQMRLAALRGPLLINDIVYAELSARYDTKEHLDEFVEGFGLERLQPSSDALFLAGKAFIRYRRAGGPRTSVLPDFFIGAHAAVLDVPLLTRDQQRYRSYFPSLELIAPDTH